MTNQLQSVIDWLIDGARSAPKAPDFMADLCQRIVACGVPLWRAGLFVRTLHPETIGRSFIWRRGEAVVVRSAPFEDEFSEDYLASPLRTIHQTGMKMRVRLSAKLEADVSPFFAEMRDEGITDYFGTPLHFSDGTVHVCSWTTKEPGGFTDLHMKDLRALLSPLARMIEIFRLRRTAAGLLDVYVGARAGERILAGQIRRGHTETMQAAIWLSDLRGFTALSDRLTSETVVEILNTYFDCQVPAILEHGGEVLKFMGDGLLAVFPIAGDDDVASVCARALTAARESARLVAAMTHSRDNVTTDGFRFGLALHLGSVLYGNIGGGNRLDFTCIGPAVNLAARMEKIAGRLNRTVVASSLFARHVKTDWDDLGEFSVAGFSEPERVYALRDDAVDLATPAH